jgi:hypothetical protein
MSALPLIAGLETGKTVSDECVHVIRYDADGKLTSSKPLRGPPPLPRSLNQPKVA